jgi:hypothetical protein
MLESHPRKRQRSLERFLGEVSAHIRGLNQPVTAFGPPRVAAPAAPLPSTVPDDERPSAAVAPTTSIHDGKPPSGSEGELQRLRNDVECVRRKNAILSELAQLGWFKFARRKQLWSELANL